MDNLYNFKKRMRPEWYDNGPVKVYTKEEIDKWEASCHDDIWAKIDAQAGLKESDIRYLDDLKAFQAEEVMEDILQGVSSDTREPSSHD